MSKIWMDPDEFLALDDRRNEERSAYKIINTADLKAKSRKRRKYGSALALYEKIIGELPIGKRFAISRITNKYGIATGDFTNYVKHWCDENGYVLKKFVGKSGGCIIEKKSI